MLGLLSFLFFFVGPILAIVAIILGVRGKKAISVSAGFKTGRGAATAGIVLGIVNLVVGALVIGLLVLVVAGAGNHTQYTNLQTGDCYNRISSSSIFSGQVDRVDCIKAHDTEVTGSFEAAPGAYPDADGFRTQAEPQCSGFADLYLGSNPATGLNIVWLAPNQFTWDSGTHTVVCGIQNADRSKHTGSVQG